FTSTRDGNVEIYAMNADGSSQTRLTNAAGADEEPSWSPDGRQIAFTSHRDGGAQIYVMNADGSGQTRLTNTPGDNTDPSWSPAYRPSSAPAHVDFTAPPPATVNANAVISPAIQITVTDASWSRVPGGVVRLEIGTSPASGATLSGTTQASAVDGVATFDNLRVDRPGSGYTLAATAPALTGAASTSFAVHLTFAAVSAGNSHTCGVTISGAAYCWGRGGILGDGTSSDQTSPVPVAGGLRFRMISAYVGPYVDRTCGATGAGAAYCWGATPAPVSGDLTFRAVT